MSLHIPKIYPITDIRISGISHLEQVRRMFDGGARFIQIRDKQSTPREFHDYAAEIIANFRGTEATIIINDRVDIALALKADGVHLGQDDLPPEQARKLLGPDAIIGFSTHSVEQAVAAAKLPIDYIAIGPVFLTSTKEDPDAVVGLDGVRAVKNAIGDIPLVAIGGITAENVASVIDAGANSAAIVSDIIADADQIGQRVSRMLGADL